MPQERRIEVRARTKPPGPVPHGLMFHHFHGGRHEASQGSLSAEDLEAILEDLDGGRILDPPEWLSGLSKGSLGPESVCLTFDDGLLSQYDVALPVLEKRGLRAFWFVYSGVFEGRPGRLEVYRRFRARCFPTVEDFYSSFFERVEAGPARARMRAVLGSKEIGRMTRAFPFYSRRDIEFRLVRDRALQVAEYDGIMESMIAEQGIRLEDLEGDLWMQDEHLQRLARRGHFIGLHSYSHPTLMERLPPDEQRREYVENARHIAAACGVPPTAVAHPSNSYNGQTLRILGSLGVQCGFRSTMKPPARPSRRRAALELPREDSANLVKRP